MGGRSLVLWARAQAKRHPGALCAASYAIGSVPFAQIAARRRAGVDLRRVGSGTVSGTSLYEVAGFAPLAAVGCCELAKGACGPLLAGRDHLLLGSLAAASAIAGHNWSPWIGFRGGRGVSLLLGAGAALAPETSALVGLALGLGRLVHRSGAATFAALVALPTLLAATRGRSGAAAGALLVVPVLAKRVLGNDNRIPASRAVLVERLVADRDRRP